MRCSAAGCIEAYGASSRQWRRGTVQATEECLRGAQLRLRSVHGSFVEGGVLVPIRIYSRVLFPVV